MEVIASVLVFLEDFEFRRRATGNVDTHLSPVLLWITPMGKVLR